MAIKDLRETIEFFTPDLGLDVQPYIDAGIKQGIHHVGRYQWATMVLVDRKPGRVVDIACGAGFGSYMLAAAMPHTQIVGVDYDERAVRYARENYQAPNLEYRVGDIVRWKSDEVELGGCDAIVSFDTLEHVLHRELAMECLSNNLTPNGALLISTPCGHNESKLNPGWEHHKVEFSHQDLFRFLSRYFGSVIQPQEREFPHPEYWRDVINKGTVRYLNRMNPVVCVEPIRSKPYTQLV